MHMQSIHMCFRELEGVVILIVIDMEKNSTFQPGWC